MATNVYDKIESVLNISGIGVFGVARVIGRNDDINAGRVRILPLNDTKDWTYIESRSNVETYPFAEPLKIGAGENHGVYYTPEFGDFVIYTTLSTGHYILGSINNPTWKYASYNIPVEAQNMQKNGLEYCTSHCPNLTEKGFHLADPKVGDIYQPASYLMRWRKNDILMYNTTKIHEEPHSAVKLMEIRTAESQMLQMVDIGNFNIKPGLKGKNVKSYSPVRQTDYRDLWEGFNINKEYWTERTDKPPLTNESQFIKLATNGHTYSEAPHPDTGKDLPDLTRGEFRLDNRKSDGSHETSKTYCPTYQTLEKAMGPDRYYQDKVPNTPWSSSVPFRFKMKKWIEDFGSPCCPENHHFNVGHYLTLSNTIFKRRAMLSTKKGHQLVMSDIDKDEKVLLNSYRGKHIYMEDGMPSSYDAMWIASQKHHMLFVDHMQAPYLIDDKGAERHRMTDPNQLSGASYQLIQTEKYQKIWLADSPECPRIHIHTTTGHELLLLDTGKGNKIQLTTNDKKMQIVLDVESGTLTIQNHTGDINLFSAKNITLDAKEMIQMRADKGFDIQATDGSYDVTACSISHSSSCGDAHKPDQIRPSVLTNIDITEGTLINKFDPS